MLADNIQFPSIGGEFPFFMEPGNIKTQKYHDKELFFDFLVVHLFIINY
ncbi:hypothetical protein J2Y40_001358 [Chryseobacterium sp. 2987]|nr:hypothetical protein [Chryseobacterium sp. 2987]